MNERAHRREDKREKRGLVMARKQDESILITCPNGDEIIITSEGSTRAQIRVSAPHDYAIDRSESLVEGLFEQK